MMKRIALAALAATTVFAAGATAAMANPDGYRDARGVWHNMDGSVPGQHHTGYRDRWGVWHNADGSIPGAWRDRNGNLHVGGGGGGGRMRGWWDQHGVWHNANGSVPGGQGYRDNRGVWHNPDGTVPGRY